MLCARVTFYLPFILYFSKNIIQESAKHGGTNQLSRDRKDQSIDYRSTNPAPFTILIKLSFIHSFIEKDIHRPINQSIKS
jgi:hypothetical protein